MTRAEASSQAGAAKAVLSFGIGRLHFVQAAEAITAHGGHLIVLQGWVPKAISGPWLDKIGGLVGSPHLSVGMKKRQLPFLPAERNISLAMPEILIQALFKIQGRFGPILGFSRGDAALAGWRAFGKASGRKIAGLSDAPAVFHCRSGAGHTAIAAARARGMRIVVDHSIAHPAFLERALKAECEAMGEPFWTTPNDPFWRQVLDDCLAADVLLVNSDFVKRTFVDEGMDPDRIKVIYLGVREDFSGVKTDYATQGRLELLFTGQFGARKGARHLVSALEALAAAGQDFHLTVLGHSADAKEMVASSSIADKITMPGFVPQDELREYLARSDLYLFPSLAEGCASSAMEALAAGLPVIATEETGLPARHDAEAVIVPAASPRALAEAIAALAADEARRARIGTAGARMMSSGFTWDDYGRKLVALYSEVSRQDGVKGGMSPAEGVG